MADYLHDAGLADPERGTGDPRAMDMTEIARCAYGLADEMLLARQRIPSEFTMPSAEDIRTRSCVTVRKLCGYLLKRART